MDASERYAELRAALLQAQTIRERLAVLASIGRFLRTLVSGEVRTKTLVLAGYACADPVGNWRATLSYAAQASAEAHHAPGVLPHLQWLRGVALCQLGRYPAAIRCLSASLRLFTEQVAAGLPKQANIAEAGAWLAYALAINGRTDAARHMMQHLPAGSAEYHVALAHIAFADKDARLAINHARCALPLLWEPKDASARWLLYTLISKCADTLHDSTTRRAASVAASHLAAVSWHAAQARQVESLPGERRDSFDASQVAAHRAWVLAGVAGSGIPGPGLRHWRYAMHLSQ